MAAITNRGLLFACCGGFIVRIALIAYGEWQDSHMVVQYTDIDYVVLSDAARIVYNGGSPYDRSTYRYTPLLAYAMLPNVLMPAFGKVLFSVLDVTLGALLFTCVTTGGFSDKAALFSAASWLFNPLSVNISTRGNAESIVCTLVIASLYFLQTKKIVLGSVLYGLAVHFKIYPILFAFPLLFHLGTPSIEKKTQQSGLSGLMLKVFNRDQWTFGFVSFIVFAGLGVTCYALYGWNFLFETYLYHVTRTDHRHNFSPYFYHMYLATSTQEVTGSLLVSLLGFAPQLCVLFVIGWKLHAKHIHLALFLMTLVFVAFNKVCTVQYFVWYLSILPLITPVLWQGLETVKNTLLVAVIVFFPWAATQGAWLYEAYLLEFTGENTFLGIWIAGLAFFLANCSAAIITIIVYSRGLRKPLSRQKMD